MNREEQAKKIQKIIAKAWADDAFKQRLLSKPSETLREKGIEVPSEVEIRVVESTSNVYYVVLPPRPSSGEVDVEVADERVAALMFCGGGGGWGGWSNG